MPSDNCNGCRKDYEFKTGKDTVHLFLEEPQHNFILAVCPHCGHRTLIFQTIHDLVAVLRSVRLVIEVAVHAPPDIAKAHKPRPKDELPSAPREWLVQLYDDLREFGGGH